MKLLEDYTSFVDEVTSVTSKSFPDMIHALAILEEQGVNPARLLTAGIGMAGEVGEFNEIIKKCLFQGKEVDKDRIIHLQKELAPNWLLHRSNDRRPCQRTAHKVRLELLRINVPDFLDGS